MSTKGVMTSRGPTANAPVLQVHLASEAHALERLTGCIEDAAALGYRRLVVPDAPAPHDGLIELLAQARAHGMLTSVAPSGAIADGWDRIAPLVDFAAISVDGTPSEHDAIRRQSGAFVAAVGTLQAIRASGVPFGILFTLTRHNVDSLDFVVHFAARSGARSVQVHPLARHGRAAGELSAAPPGSAELAFAIGEAARLAREVGVAVHVDALTVEQLRAHRSALVPARPVTAIAAVAHTLVVDGDSTVAPLRRGIGPHLALGSLERAGLAALVRAWLRGGRGDALADVCAQTWSDLITAPTGSAMSWYDEVAARTRRPLRALSTSGNGVTRLSRARSAFA